MILFSPSFVGNPLTQDKSSDSQGQLHGTYAQKLNPWGDLKGRFLYWSEEAVQSQLFPRDFMAHHQPLLEIKTFKKSDMSFYVMKGSSDLNCVQLVKLYLLKEYEVAVWRAVVLGWCQRLTFWALGSKCDCFPCFWKSPECTGLLSWTCSWVWFCVLG